MHEFSVTSDKTAALAVEALANLATATASDRECFAGKMSLIADLTEKSLQGEHEPSHKGSGDCQLESKVGGSNKIWW